MRPDHVCRCLVSHVARDFRTPVAALITVILFLALDTAGGAQKHKVLGRNGIAPTADRDQHQSIMDIGA